MKRLLLIALLFVAFDSFSQPLNYTRIANRYRWISGMFDSALYVPRYNGTPSGVRVGENSAIDGAIAIDTANSRAYMYSGGAWVRLANYSEVGGTYTAGDGLLLTASDFKVLTKRSITIDSDSLMLVNDTTATPANYFYGMNSAGRRTWLPQSGLVGVNIYNSDGTLTGDRTVDFNVNDLTFNTNGGYFNIETDDPGNVVEHYNITGEAGARLQIQGDGHLEWGDGTGLIDVGLQRFKKYGLGYLSLVPMFYLVNETTTTDSTIIRFAQGSDTTSFQNNATIYYNGANSRFGINTGSGFYIHNLDYTLSTTGKKIMLRDTASGLVQNIDPSLLNGGSPAGNYGNVQLNRNGAFATPASDSVDYESATGLTVKNNVTVEGTGKYFYGRWRARVDSATSSATPTINTDNVDIYKITALAADITSMTTNLSGTPQDGDILELVITGTAARAITWGASFVSTTVTLPTTTVTTATLTVILQYYKSSSYGNNKWHCVNSY